MSTVEQVRPAPATPVEIGRGARWSGYGQDPTNRPMVEEPGDHSRCTHVFRRLLDLGGIPERELLRRGGSPPRPDLAVLLPVSRRKLRAGKSPVFHLDAMDDLARHPDPDRAARIPVHLLLLPARLLPGVLAVTSSCAVGDAHGLVLGRVALSPDPPEHPPLLLLPRPLS